MIDWFRILGKTIKLDTLTGEIYCIFVENIYEPLYDIMWIFDKVEEMTITQLKMEI